MFLSDDSTPVFFRPHCSTTIAEFISICWPLDHLLTPWVSARASVQTSQPFFANDLSDDSLTSGLSALADPVISCSRCSGHHHHALGTVLIHRDLLFVFAFLFCVWVPMSSTGLWWIGRRIGCRLLHPWFPFGRVYLHRHLLFLDRVDEGGSLGLGLHDRLFLEDLGWFDQHSRRTSHFNQSFSSRCYYPFRHSFCWGKLDRCAVTWHAGPLCLA